MSVKKKQKPKKRILLIVNPKAGIKYQKTSVSEISEYFAKHKYESAIYFTSPEYSAKFLVKEHAKDFDIIACCGGDGTVNEIIGGMMEINAAPPLGYIPSGSTNDLASSLGLPLNKKRAAKTIISEKAFPFDVGTFNDSYFVYIASFGAFTDVSYDTPREAKNILGHTAYIFHAVKSMSKIRTYKIKIVADGKNYEGEYIFGSVTNSTSVAGTFHFEDDMVDFADGKYEVMLIKRPKSLFNAFSIYMSMMNRSYKHENIQIFHASEIKVYSEEPIDWALDGEHKLGGTTVTIKNNPRAVNIIRKK